MSEDRGNEVSGGKPNHLGGVLEKLGEHLVGGGFFRSTDSQSAGVESDDHGSYQSGTVLDDFKLLTLLGRGGMGEVWEAEQISMRRRVALKLLHAHLKMSEVGVGRFQREARAGGMLTHPGLVQVYVIGVVDGVHFMAQELVEGSYTLADSLDEFRKQNETSKDYYKMVAVLFAEMAEALAHAHESGVIHRDLKPSNILLSADDKAKIADFGLAMVEDELGLSRTGEISGTPYYMSPEQAAAKRMGLDHRTDIFSLGATLYEALTLSRPFHGDTSQQLFHQILVVDPPAPGSLRSRVPRDLSVICMKSMEKDPVQRYESMAELSADLKRYLADEPILAQPPGVLRRAVKWSRRNPTKSTAALLVFAGLLGMTGMWLQAEKARAQTEEALALADEMFAERAESIFSAGDGSLGLLWDAAKFSKGEAAEHPARAARRLRSVGLTLKQHGALEDAARCLQDACEIFNLEGPHFREEERKTKLELGIVKDFQGDLEAAMALYEEVIKEEGGAVEDVVGADAYSRLWSLKRETSRYGGEDEAAALEGEHGEVMAALDGVLASLSGGDHVEVLRAEVARARVRWIKDGAGTKEEYDELIQLRERVEAAYGEEHELSLSVLGIQIQALIQKLPGIDRATKLADGLKSSEEMLARARRSLPEDHYFLGVASDGLSFFVWEDRSTEDTHAHDLSALEAFQLKQKAKEIYDARLGRLSRKAVLLTATYATLGSHTVHAEVVEPVCHDLLDLYRECLGPTSASVGWAQRLLGVNLRSQGRFEEAISAYQDGISVFEEAGSLHQAEVPRNFTDQYVLLVAGRDLEGMHTVVDRYLDVLYQYGTEGSSFFQSWTGVIIGFHEMRGLSLYFRGDLERAAADFSKAVDISRVVDRGNTSEDGVEVISVTTRYLSGLHSIASSRDVALCLQLLEDLREDDTEKHRRLIAHCAVGEECVRIGELDRAREQLLFAASLGSDPTLKLGPVQRDRYSAWPNALQESINGRER